ncbi:MAG: hypothetical protein AB7L84_13940 [Acidimicrobiia bacterium]
MTGRPATGGTSSWPVLPLPRDAPADAVHDAFLRKLSAGLASTVEVDGETTDRLSQLLGRSTGAPGAMPWAVLVFPTLAAPDLEPPRNVWEVYRRLEWDGPLSRGPLQVEVVPRYASVAGGSTEISAETRVVAASGATARSVTVLRVAGSTGAFGARDLPECAAVGPTERGSSLVFDEVSLDGFIALARLHHPAVDSETTAHGYGLQNRLVPSPLLMCAVLRRDSAPSGRIDMWFRRPVPVGALVNIGELTVGDRVEGVITLPSKRRVAVFRHTCV